MKDPLGHGSDGRGGTIQKRPAGWTREIGGRITHGPWPDKAAVTEAVAKDALSSGGPKSAPVPVHDAMSNADPRHDNLSTPLRSDTVLD